MAAPVKHHRVSEDGTITPLTRRPGELTKYCALNDFATQLTSTLLGMTLVIACSPSRAQTAVEQTVIVVEATADAATALAGRRVSSSDTASLLAGVDSSQAGGVSSLPMIHGLGDDRILTLVNDVPIAAACPMHMNPPLSYIDPTNTSRIEILPGVTPVSLGGDSIGGTILVESAPPKFAPTNSVVGRDGSISSFYRSNGAAIGAVAAASIAASNASFAYEGSGVRAQDYRDGVGERINASRFATSNQQVMAAYRSGQHLYEVQIAVQYMPYEGFPNADMDLTENVGTFINARYQGGFDWGAMNISAYYDHIDHQMNGNTPDRYPPSLDITGFGVFPTRERGQDFGYRVKADIAASARDTLRLGNELHGQTLEDRWPGAPVGAKFDYISINNGTRTQLGTFAEWERRWSGRWITLAGVRNDTIWMDTGPVQGYDGTDSTAQAFNASHRARTDVNVDATLLVRYQPDDRQSYSVGVARKNRSPNFYERYAWGTNTIGTITWFGDGNGYTGRPGLKPETAYTASISGDWHDRAAQSWEVKVTTFYTRVQDYIGAVAICGPTCSGMPGSQLMFANHSARLYGTDVSAAYALANTPEVGVFRLTALGGFVRGNDLSTNTNLYHMMPVHGTIGLEHQRGKWSSALEFRAVDHKTEVDTTRLEPRTPSYAVLNLRTVYEWRSVRFDFAITNLLDRQYENPLGGTWQSDLYPPGYLGPSFRPLPAAGRSFNTGVTVKL
jgi:iron complex outermembrane receptor protein